MCLEFLSERDCVGGRGLSGEIRVLVEYCHFWASDWKDGLTSGFDLVTHSSAILRHCFHSLL